MSLIAMAVHDTEENKRTSYTKETLQSLLATVNFTKHRLFIIDNNSCKKTDDLLLEFEDIWFNNRLPYESLTIIRNTENLGTAKAINMAWTQRKTNEHCIKIDNDVVINYKGWVEEMEAAVKAEPLIGQIGLKRKDCWEYPEHENPELRSHLIMLPHVAGERWVVVEQAKHIIGTCVLHSSALLDKIGYLYQPGLYGYDDVLMSWRSNLAGFICVFLPHIDIDHIDTGQTDYQKWKEKHSGCYSKEISDLVDEYIAGTKSIHYD